MNHFFTIAALSTLLFSCSSSDESIQFETAIADKTVKLTSENDSPLCSVHLEVAYATEANGHKAEIMNNIIEKQLLNMQDLPMASAVDSFANEYTASYQEHLQPLYRQDQNDPKSSNGITIIISSRPQRNKVVTMQPFIISTSIIMRAVPMASTST